MNIKTVIPPPEHNRFEKGAFKDQVGKTIKINVPGRKKKADAVVVEAEVLHNGNVMMTLEVPEDIGRLFHEPWKT